MCRCGPRPRRLRPRCLTVRRARADFVNVIQEECKLHQALIKDRHQPNLFMLAASQTRDKSALTTQGVEDVISQLRSSFDYIVCDSPAGIENGATQAMRHADIALVCTNPELSSVRDSDKVRRAGASARPTTVPSAGLAAPRAPF